MAWKNLLDVIYPDGTVYASHNSTSPAILFGGTWTQTTSNDPSSQLYSIDAAVNVWERGASASAGGAFIPKKSSWDNLSFVYSGTAAPSSSLGSNGDLYVQYTA